MDTIARIRREHFVHGRSIKEIVRALHVSRNTVRKVLRSGKTAFAYERDVQPLPKLASGGSSSMSCWRPMGRRRLANG